MKKFIIYSRKSRTSQDGHTQHTHQTAEWHVNNYLRQLDAQGIQYKIVSSHQEDISGGGYYTKRPIFSGIVDQCKKDKSLTLLVAKADRMTRNVRTGAELMETLDFVLANAPDADDMQKHLEFMIAEREYKSISQRFKDMYQAKKKRCEDAGERLVWGASSPKHQQSFQANKANHKKNSLNTKVRDAQQPIVEKVSSIIRYSGGKVTQGGIAKILNEEGVQTVNGKQFTQAIVSRMIKKYEIRTRY